MALWTLCPLLLPYGPLTELSAPSLHPACSNRREVLHETPRTLRERGGQWLAAMFWISVSSARSGETQGRKAPEMGPCRFRSRISKLQQDPARQPSQGPGPPRLSQHKPQILFPGQPRHWPEPRQRTRSGGRKMEAPASGNGLSGAPGRGGTGRASCCQPQHAAARSSCFCTSSEPDPGLPKAASGAVRAAGRAFRGCALTLGDEDAWPFSLVTGSTWGTWGWTLYGKLLAPQPGGHLLKLSPAHGTPPEHQPCPQWLLRNWL